VAVGGTFAVAGGTGVWRRSDGVVEIDAQSLTPLYYGERLSVGQIVKLNEQGKAMAAVVNIEAACHGVDLYFDTQAEADAYGADFVSRQKALRAAQKANGTFTATPPEDPCTDWLAPLPTFSRVG
jgi:hypothetical protein